MIRVTAKKACGALLVAMLMVIAGNYGAMASPFGQGVFSADVPFGANTSMSIALTGTVDLALTDDGNGAFVGDGAHTVTVTVTSTDVVGYRLYVYAPGSAALENGSETIPASSNTNLATLTTDTWGYNTIGSTTNFIGITNVPAVINDATGPHKDSDPTTVTYGVKTSPTKGAGDYTATLVYTAVGKSE